eukprot:TRINITY_DN22270_c0_g2_i2.p2 TRINITY_DN22270_c0_g2~~TRINITY_DN22270_c0_g2_i2.p2  ORF type:complete len:112 (+),score=22.67 TRINITY_DN22270_c0_g2_i2:47-337(+)
MLKRTLPSLKWFDQRHLNIAAEGGHQRQYGKIREMAAPGKGSGMANREYFDVVPTSTYEKLEARKRAEGRESVLEILRQPYFVMKKESRPVTSSPP